MDAIGPELGLRCRIDGRCDWITGARYGESIGSVAVIGVDDGKWALFNGSKQWDVVDALQSTNLRFVTKVDVPDSGSDVCLNITG